MMNIYKEIGDLQQKSSDVAAKNLKESHRYKVEEALRFFKGETLRLSKIYKENETEIEKLKKVAEAKEFDKKFLEMQISKKQQKIDSLKLSVEQTTSLVRKLAGDTENPILPKPTNNELVKNKPKMSPVDYAKSIEDFMIKLMDMNLPDEEIISEIAKYMQLYNTEVEKQIKHLRSELEFEKTKHQQVRKAFLDQVTNRSELETFFFECLGEMRKEILHKGPKGLVGDANFSGENLNKSKLDPNKYQALQAVLSNDRILITLFDEIFGPPAKRTDENSKNFIGAKKLGIPSKSLIENENLFPNPGIFNKLYKK